jgi:hypothetical protein
MNAGDLDSPITLQDYEHEKNIEAYGIGKTYCLPEDYFDEYSPIPYCNYYRVSDNTLVGDDNGK